MPVSRNRRKNGKLKKRNHQVIRVNSKPEQLEELEEIRNDDKRINKIKKLLNSSVEGLFDKEVLKKRKRLHVDSSILLQRTRDKIKQIRHSIVKKKDQIRLDGIALKQQLADHLAYLRKENPAFANV